VNSILGRLPKRASFVALSIAALAASACSGRSTVTPPIATNPALLAPSATGSSAAHFKKPKTGQIQHVVVIIQENRSFDNLFQATRARTRRLRSCRSPRQRAAARRCRDDAVSIPLQQISLDTHFDIYHDHFTWLIAWDNGEHGRLQPGGPIPAQSGFTAPMYSYVPQKDVKPYWAMAQAIRAGRRHVRITHRRELRRASVFDRRAGEPRGRLPVARQRRRRPVGLRRRTNRHHPSAAAEPEPEPSSGPGIARAGLRRSADAGRRARYGKAPLEALLLRRHHCQAVNEPEKTATGSRTKPSAISTMARTTRT
jgi:hypothetical protein